MALVIKQWHSTTEPDDNGNYVHIIGREGGLLSWLLSLLGIDPVSEVEIKGDVIRFKRSSLAGKELRVIPMKSLTSAYFAYEKPWKTAAAIGLAGVGIATQSMVVGLAVIAIAAIFYALNKNLSVAVVEASGWSGDFAFKRSVIEGQNINEQSGYEVIDIIRGLVQSKNT